MALMLLVVITICVIIIVSVIGYTEVKRKEKESTYTEKFYSSEELKLKLKQYSVNCRVDKKDYYLGIAEAVAKRSNCLSKRYGAIIVKNDEIISTGYNGSPRGEDNCCDLKICSRKIEGGHYANDGNYSSCCSVHAEQNAIISASRKDMIDATLYLYGEKSDGMFWRSLHNPEPCPICDRMIRNAGIIKVIS